MNGVNGLSSHFGAGEVATSIAAILFAPEIVLISRAPPRLSIARVTFVQFATASLLASLRIPIFAEPLPPLSNTFVVSVLEVGCGSGVVQYMMNWAQKLISATKATLIYSGEPVWARAIGHFTGEHLAGSVFAGVLLIISAGIFSEWPKNRRCKNRTRRYTVKPDQNAFCLIARQAIAQPPGDSLLAPWQRYGLQCLPGSAGASCHA